MIEYTKSGRAITGICDTCQCVSSEENAVAIINDEFICEVCLTAPMSEEEFLEMCLNG